MYPVALVLFDSLC